MYKCRICGSADDHEKYFIKEMHFGINEEFEYFKCLKCNCLQISEIPVDIGKYYPSNYYSFKPLSDSNKAEDVKKSIAASIIKGIKIEIGKHRITGKGYLGKALNKLKPLPKIYELLAECNLNTKSRILDIGCGRGMLLHELKEKGFEDVSGIDPYLENRIAYANGLVIDKCDIYELVKRNTGKYDLIMMNHSFEHMSDPLRIMETVRRMLTENGICMIRIPVIDSWAWDHYRTNWVQIDAPRHYYIHSRQSMKMIGDFAELRLDKIIYDSTDFQFWGSEQYLKGIPLVSKQSRVYCRDLLPTEMMQKYKAQAMTLNKQQKGDMAAFYYIKQ